jgi:hypothetical protein
VTRDGDLPPEPISVRATPEAGGVPPLRIRCAQDGSFDVDGLAAGAWLVSAEAQEMDRPPVMTTRRERVVLEQGRRAPPLELRLLTIAEVTVRLNGMFADGEPPTSDRGSPRYGDLVRKVGQFRIRCRDDAGVSWIDSRIDGLSFRVADRDLIVTLPLPEGSYALALDHGEDEIESRRIASPGSAEIRVRDP